MAFQQYPQKFGTPSGSTAQRPSSPVIGDTFYNGTLEILEIWNGTSWVAVSSPAATPIITSVTDASSGNAYSSSSAGSLSVAIEPGSGGSTPTQYNIYTTAGGFSAYGSTSPIVLTGLTLGTGYVVYANAQNNFGTTTNTVNFATRTPTTRPQVPTIGTATVSGDNVTAVWTLGNNGGTGLTSITITPYLNGTTAQTSRTATTTSDTSYTFTGASALTVGSSYTFKVKVTNANGDSPESTASNSVVPGEYTVDYLVVAGGGSGGGWASMPTISTGGGGGAGGYKTSTLVVAASSTSTVTVGAGGTGGGVVVEFVG
jgi:hypothetical protein